MITFTVEEICQATGAILQNTGKDRVFTGVSTDTRTIKAGDIFVALAGERFDGHQFVDQAVQRGAAGVIVSRPVGDLTPKCAVFLVKNTLNALHNLARWHRKRFAIPVIAITGSNGKTTTKDLVAAVLASKFEVLKTQANYNNEIGLPLTLLQLTEQHQAAVVEMGMRGRGQISELAAIALPTIGIVTNVGETHIELLGSIENIAAAKAELVETIEPAGLAILNADNQYVRDMSRQARCRTILYGIEAADVTVRAANIVTSGTGTEFDCMAAGERQRLWVPLPGRHNVYNALAAVAVGLELGLNWEQIARGLSQVVPSGMRLAITRHKEYIIINDAYNASPLSMRAAIDTLSEVAEGRKIAVLGDMLELGHLAKTAHQAVGEQLVVRKIDVVITVGELARYIAQTAQKGGIPQVIACDNHAQAKQALAAILRPGDTILVKGSRGMQMEQVLELFD